MVKKLTTDLDQHSEVFCIKNMVKLDILDNIFIIIICFPLDDVISFVINLSSLIKLFFLHDRKGQDEIKRIFHLF